MIFSVTAKDIKEGTRKSKVACPVARALSRRFPRATIRVYPSGILLNDIFFSLPEKVSHFIECFDTKHSVKPIRFKLKIQLGEFDD